MHTHVLSTKVKQEDNKVAEGQPKAKVEKEYCRRPKILTGATYKMKTPLGKAYITVNDVDGKPFEVIVNVGKAGSDVFAMSEALGRVSTLFLRFGEIPDGNKARLLIKHSGAVGFDPNRVESIADAVAKALGMHMDGEDPNNSIAATTEPVLNRHNEHEGIDAEYHNQNSNNNDAFILNDDVPDGLDLCPTCGSASLVNDMAKVTKRRVRKYRKNIS